MSNFKTYFIQAGDLVKIGKSKDPARRLRDIRATNPHARLVTYLEEDIERDLHDRFKKLREHCEWFRIKPPLIRYLKDEYDIVIEDDGTLAYVNREECSRSVIHNLKKTLVRDTALVKELDWFELDNLCVRKNLYVDDGLIEEGDFSFSYDDPDLFRFLKLRDALWVVEPTSHLEIVPKTIFDFAESDLYYFLDSYFAVMGAYTFDSFGRTRSVDLEDIAHEARVKEFYEGDKT